MKMKIAWGVEEANEERPFCLLLTRNIVFITSDS